MQVENLRQEDVSVLEDTISELKKTNPDITHKIFEMQKAIEREEDKPIQQQLDKLAEEVNNISLMLKKIFADYVLIDGQFKRINV